MLARRQGRLLIFVLLAVFAASVATAHAESVVWNSLEPNLIEIGTTAGANRWTVHLLDTNVSVQYRVSVYASDSSAAKLMPLSSGAVIPIDSWVLFTFEPHLYTDINWFGVGRAYDTPYGDWTTGAVAPPTSDRCTPKNLYQEGDTVYGKGTGNEPNARLYAALSVAPPNKNVQVMTQSICTPVAGTSNVLCHFTQPETVSTLFTFASTIGEFYAGQWRSNKCLYSNNPMTLYGGERVSAGDYQLNVPQQSIPFTIIVVGSDEEEETATTTPSTTPTQPSLSASGGAACVVGQSYSISMSSTDPEGDAVRYLIDWNGDGGVDVFVPGSGYVPSGTSLTTSRTFATSGNKSVRVRAQDEGGTLSPWATFNFSCAGSGEAGMNENGNNGTNENNGTNLPPQADLQLRVIPSLVRKGNTTNVNWSATGMSECTVEGTNNDSWSSLSSPVGGQLSSPIQGETKYTLTCEGLDGDTYQRQATVRVLPNWRER